MKRNFLIFVFFCAYSFYGYCGLNIDSLKVVIKEYSQIIESGTDDSITFATYLKLADSYENASNYAECLKTLNKGVKSAELAKDTFALNELLYYSSVIYQRLNKNEQAISFGKKALELSTIVKDSITIAASCHRLGIAHQTLGEKAKAQEYLLQSLQIRNKLGYPYPIAASNNALGLTYLPENIEKANEHFITAYSIWKNMNNKEGIAIAAGNIGDNYLRKKDTLKAISYLKQSYNAAKAVNNLYFLSGTSHNLAEIYNQLNNKDSAHFFLKEYTIANDSLFNVESNKTIEEMRAKYESEKAAQQLLFQEELLTQKEVELKQQKAIGWMTGAASFLLLSMLGVAYYGFIQKKRANEELHQKNLIIEEKNQAITDSITYAKRIQDALLLNENAGKGFKEYFVLFKPKDIVSGDFYWTSQQNNYSYIAAADCTGHGVPGAFMSMLGMSLLNDIISDNPIAKPAEILDSLRTRIIKELSQSVNGSESRDGLDISLARLDTNTLQLDWAGANNPLWILEKDTNSFQLEEIKPDRQPIGQYINMHPFTNNSLQLKKGQVFYLFSDGYADQFGGEKGKKLKSKVFMKLIEKNINKSMSAQKEALNTAFEDWKGPHEQIDDVCVIGVRV